MSSSEDEHIFAWPLAIIDAEESGNMHRIAYLLRNETVPITMEDRRMLADFLVPKAGRPTTGLRDYDFFNEVESYKYQHKGEKTHDDVLEEVGKKYKLLSFDTRRAAFKRGSKISRAISDLNNE